MEPLAQRLARGEAAAFAEMYDAWADRLHYFLTVRLGSRDDADEVLQEVFLRLVRHRGRFEGVNSLAGYLFTVARNEAFRFREKRRRDANTTSLTVDDLFTEGDNTQQREVISEALLRLTEDQQEVITLKVYGGLTFREIAEVTGVPLQTAATRYRAALEKLRVFLS